MIMAYAEYGRKRLWIGSLTDQTVRLLRNSKPLSDGIVPQPTLTTSPGRKLGLTDAFGVVARATISAEGVSIPSNFESAYSRLGSTIVAGITANWLAPPLGNAPWWDLW